MPKKKGSIDLEREACARIAETAGMWHRDPLEGSLEPLEQQGFDTAAKAIADAIRDRGRKGEHTKPLTIKTEEDIREMTACLLDAHTSLDKHEWANGQFSMAISFGRWIVGESNLFQDFLEKYREIKSRRQ